MVLKQGRFFHLDALRSILMLWGVAVHTSTLGTSQPFDWVTSVSGLFRMETFFLISGFFGYMSLERYPPKEYLKKRLLGLSAPLIFVLVLLNPVTYLLIYNFHNSPISISEFIRQEFAENPNGPANWHLHLWFLIVLIVYSAITPSLYKIIKKFPTFDQLFEGKASSFISFLAIGGLGALFTIVGRVVYEILFETWIHQSAIYPIRSTFYFSFFYVYGMFLFHSETALNSFHRPKWVILAVAFGLSILISHYFDHLPKPLAEALKLGSSSFLAFSISNILFYIFRSWLSKEYKSITFLSKSIYAIYLLHFFVIYLVAHIIRSSIGYPLENSTIFMLAVCASTIFITLQFYSSCVRKSKLLALFFCGKWALLNRK